MIVEAKRRRITAFEYRDLDAMFVGLIARVRRLELRHKTLRDAW